MPIYTLWNLLLHVDLYIIYRCTSKRSDHDEVMHHYNENPAILYMQAGCDSISREILYSDSML